MIYSNLTVSLFFVFFFFIQNFTNETIPPFVTFLFCFDL